MTYKTTLLISMFQFILILPTSFYILSLGFVGLFFTLFMISGLIAILALYYPLIAINQ
jgi:hypothetical protein